MKVALAVLVVLVMTGSYTWAQSQSGAMAPPTGTQPQHPMQESATSDTPTSQVREVQGMITSMDPKGKSVTLDDGTLLMVPDSLRAARSALKEGARVKASYKERAGQKVATSIQVESRS